MSKLNLNEFRRIIGYSYLLYVVLIIPVSLFHELGHAAVCSASGYTFSIWLDFRGGHSICYGVFNNTFLIGAMGGIFGLIAASVMFGVWYLSGKFAPIAVVGSAFALDQGLKVILETAVPRLYAAGAFDLSITVLQILSVALFAVYFAKRQMLPSLKELQR
jgi:hypothetical protein